MKSFLRSIILSLGISLILVLFALIDFKIVFGSAEKTKSIISKSQIYQLVATTLKTSIAQGIPENDGRDAVLKMVNSSVGEENMRRLTEDTVDQVYKSIEDNSANPTLTVHFSFVKEDLLNEINQQSKEAGAAFEFPSDYQVNLKDNLAIKLLSQIDRNIMITIGAIIFTILLIGLLCGSWSQRAAWVGMMFFLAGFAVLAEAFFFQYITPSVLDSMISTGSLSSEGYILSAKKFINAITDIFKVYNWVEGISAVVLGAVFMICAKLFKSKKNIINKTTVDPITQAQKA